MVARDVGCTVAELEDRLGSVEMLEWITLYQMEAAETKAAARR